METFVLLWYRHISMESLFYDQPMDMPYFKFACWSIDFIMSLRNSIRTLTEYTLKVLIVSFDLMLRYHRPLFVCQQMQARLQRRYQSPQTIFHMTAIFRSYRNVIAKKSRTSFLFTETMMRGINVLFVVKRLHFRCN